MADDEFDNLPDDLANQDIDWDNILGASSNSLSMHHSTESIPVPGPSSPRPASSRSSDYFDGDGQVDDAVLQALDQLEQRLTQNPLQPSGPRYSTVSTIANQATKPPSNNSSLQLPLKRQRSDDECTYSISKKGKTKASEAETHFLTAFEDEVTCPICCDLFVAAQVGNPCGHSVCGECGWLWTKKNRNNGCPVCRASFVRSRPMIPNIALDGIVERYIQALRMSGDKNWEPGGAKYIEWNSRKEQWKKDIAERAKTSRQPQKAIVHLINMADINAFEGPWPDGDEDDGDYYEEGDGAGLIPPSVPRERRRRGRRQSYR